MTRISKYPRYPKHPGGTNKGSKRLSRFGCVGLLVSLCAVSCAGNFDSTRVQRPFEDESTIGQEAFGVLCDRLGASVLQEDLDGLSYRDMCHPNARGEYDDTVNEAHLPTVTGVTALERNLALAKMHAFSAHRADFIRAVDTIVPDVLRDNPAAGQRRSDGTIEPDKIRLFDAMLVMIERLNPLYDSNPLVSEGPNAVPLLPTMTQSLARVVKVLSEDERAHRALASMGGRKGYRPASMSLGALRPVLQYPRLRTLYQHSVRLMSPGGRAWEPFTRLLDVVHEHLRGADFETPLGPFVVTDPDGIAQPNRPRDTLEVLEHILLATDPTFGSVSPEYAVMRDSRGFALVAGNTPGLVGTVQAPFADVNKDGFADVDEFGRFVDASKVPVAVDYPFDVPGKKRVRAADSYGRALLANGELAYQYVDTSRTFAAAFLKDIGALADTKQGNETLMYLVAALPVLLGDRKTLIHTFGKGSKSRSVKFLGFDAETSPLVLLTHALGQVLAHPQSDDFLQMMIDLVENHPEVVARLAGVLVQLKHIADDYPDLEIPRDSNLWNQLSSMLGKISQVAVSKTDPDAQGLMEDILLAFANPDTLELGDLYAKFMTFRDVMTYDVNDINGPAWNITTNNHNAPSTPVDRSKPCVGDNRSMFFRTMQLIFDSTGTTACNKQNAKVYLKAEALGAIGLNVVYPDDGMFGLLCPGTRKDPLDWCDVYRIDSLTEFYLRSVVESDPKLSAGLNKGKAQMIINDKCLSSLKWATDMDQAFELSSGITGMTTRPTPSALNRLVHFGADSLRYTMPDLDPQRQTDNTLNFQVNRFIGQMQDPFGTPVCTKNATGVDLCTSSDDTLRVRDFGTLFLWEQFRFREVNRPLLYAFYKHDQEKLFADLMDVVYFHMEPKDHGSWCSKTGSWDRTSSQFNPRYCAETGLVNFEPMLARMLSTDLVPAIHDLAKVGQQQRISSVRYRAAKHPDRLERRGTEVLTTLVRAMVDPMVAQDNKVQSRDGKRDTVWNDGVTKQEQITPFDLLLKAFQAIDDRFENAKDYDAADLAQRKQDWTRAGGQLMDHFLAVDGSGADTRFRNPAIPKALGVILRTIREQLNAHCPEREKGQACVWAKTGLANKMAEIIQDPLLATTVDLFDELRKDPSRDELELFIQYMVAQEKGGETLRQLLSSSVDLLGLLRDGQVWPPVLNALAHIARPEDDQTGPLSADVIMQLLHILSRDGDEQLGTDDPLAFDAYHVFNFVLANITNPIDPNKPSKSALGVLLDAALDVNRIDSASSEPMSASDYEAMMKASYLILTDETRGLEQLYTIIRGARGD